MPIFEFECRTCGHVFEELRFSSDKPKRARCPKCRGLKTERLFSVFGFGGSSERSSSSSCDTCSSKDCSSC